MKIALGQNAVTGSPPEQFQLLECQLLEAREKGVDLFCTQELFLTPYFCSTQCPDNFDLAHEVNEEAPIVERLCSLAAAAELVLVASLFEQVTDGLYYNTAVIIDKDGTYLGKYRKSHIPQDPGFEEKFYFTPGDSGYPVWDTLVGKVGVLICWDQWFPEAARLMALAGAELILYPTAIGWQAEEKRALGAAQHHAWQTVMQGHAIANGIHIAAVNRTGTEGDPHTGTEFWGQSFVANPYGELIARASATDDEVLVAELDSVKQRDFRRIWPFFRDRRIDTYAPLTERWSEH